MMPGTSSPSTPIRFATKVESAGPGRGVEAGEHRRGVGAASVAARITALQKAVPSSSRSQVTQATGTPAARCWSA